MTQTIKAVEDAGGDYLEITDTIESKKIITKKELLDRKTGADLLLAEFEK